MYGSSKLKRPFHRFVLWTSAYAFAYAAVLCLPVSTQATVGLSFSGDPFQPFHLPWKSISEDSIPVFEAGTLLISPQVQKSSGSSAQDLDIKTSLLGPRSALLAEAGPMSLDLQTFRAFQGQEQVVKTWNRDVMALMKKPDRDKRGPLRIGVELPSAMASVVGEGGAGLQVSGYRRITFSGRSQWNNTKNVSAVRQSKFPSLTMEQISRFTVEGTVGSKVSVKVDQDSKRLTDLENRIQIRYKGDEDDVLKTIEAGNTTLALPNTQFVGYSQSIQGLFGLKASAQVGPIDVTMITSQEKGNSVRSRYTAGANEQAVTIRDYEYARNRFFDLGWLGDSLYVEPGDVIDTFYLFQGVGSQQEGGDPKGTAWVNALDTTSFLGHESFQKYRQLKIQTDYVLLNDRFYVYFPVARSGFENTVLAYYMVVRKKDGSLVRFGDVSSAPYRLQMLKPAVPTPADPLWKAEWKNVYDLRIKPGTDYNDIQTLDIYMGQRGTENDPVNINHQNKVPYLELFGLDRTGPSGSGDPDSKVDLKDANGNDILDLSNGLLIFPDQRPFDPPAGTRHSPRFPDSTLHEAVPTIYDWSKPQDRIDSSKYFIKLVTRSRSTRVNLGHVNILPQSEVVTLNSARLVSGTDYTIDYEIGEITFLNDRVLDKNASLTIDYGYSPFLSGDKRTLLGLRSEYAPGPDFHTGTTFLYKGSKTTDRPAQLGQEPFRDMVLDYDVYWKTSPRFLTRLADALPFVETQAPSNLTFAAEVARSMPNPNTQGRVLIDDFESAKRSSSLGIFREGWAIASPPRDSLDFAWHRPARGFYDRGFIWFNPFKQFNETDIYNRQVRNQSESRTHVLVFEFRPGSSPTKDSTGGAWGGIMRALPKDAWIQSGAEYIELRMAVVGKVPGKRTGMLHIDLGRISEDVNANDTLDTEDKNANLILDQGEDVGLDGRPDTAEVSPDGRPWNAATNPDPAGDNWEWDPNQVDAYGRYNYDRINGTQGNELDYRHSIPDTEDLSNDLQLDRLDSYFSYKVDLTEPDTTIRVEASLKRSSDVTGYANGQLEWYTYRIPLWNPAYPYDRIHAFSDSTPSPNNIRYARVWLSDADTTMRLYIAAMDIVEGGWKAAATAEGSKFRVAVKNTEENTDYEPPPGVSGYRDPTTNVREKEQSLALVYENLLPGDTGKTSPGSQPAQDVTGYRYLKMYVHGDRALPADTEMTFYLRFGQDSKNCYYYSNTVQPGWDDNNLVVDFDRLTAFKEDVRRSSPPGKTPADTFSVAEHLGVRGQPSLSRISYLEMGVVATGDPVTRHSGEIWCDELRLDAVRKDIGTAGRIRVSSQIADLLQVTGNIDQKNYAFRTLNDGRGGSVLNSSSAFSTGFNGAFSLQKFFPETWGLAIPLSVNYSKNVGTPKLLTGSDVVLSQNQQEAARSTSITEGVSTGLSWTPKTKNWLVSSTLGALKLSNASMTRQRSWSPTTPYSITEGYNAGASYALTFPHRLTFPPLYWMRFLLAPKRLYDTPLSLLPTDFSASGTVSRSKSTTVNSSYLLTHVYARDFNGNARVGLKPLPALTIGYNMTTSRDVSRPEELKFSFNPKIGRETRFNERLTADYKPYVFSFFSPSFNYSADFNDQMTYLTGIVHDVQRNRQVTVGGTFDLPKFWSFLGKAKPKPKAPGKSGSRSGDKQTHTTRPMSDLDIKAEGSKPEQPKGDEDKPSVHHDGSAPLVGPVNDDHGAEAANAPSRPDVFGPPSPDTTKKGARPGEPHRLGGGFGPVVAWQGLLSGLDWITSPIGPTSVSYTRRDGNTLTLGERPSKQFQFGFSSDPNAPVGPGSSSRPPSSSNSYEFNVKNQLRIANILTFGNGYVYVQSERKQSGSTSVTRGQTFPSLSTSLDRIERFKPVGMVFTSANLRFGYNKKWDESQTGSALKTRNTTSAFSPLISLTGTIKKGVRFSFTAERSASQTHTAEAGGSDTQSKTRSWRANADYAFRSPKGIPLPFLRSLKLNSQLSVTLSILHKSSESYAGGKLTQSNSELTLSPQGNYSFSARVKGGFTAQWSDIKTRSSSGTNTSHTRALGIWAEFSF